MTNDPLEILQSLKSITLEEGELRGMRERLAAYAQMNPIFEYEEEEATPSPYFPTMRTFAFLQQRGFAYALIALVLIGGVGGTAVYAAGGSVPGDALYAVKTHVSEPVALALASTPLQKAEVLTDQANERVIEEATLAKKGTLTDATRTTLEEKFDAALASSNDEARTLDASGNPADAMTVRAGIDAKLASDDSALGQASTSVLSSLRDRIRARRMAIAAERRATIVRLAPIRGLAVASSTENSSITTGTDVATTTDSSRNRRKLINALSIQGSASTTSTIIVNGSSVQGSNGSNLNSLFLPSNDAIPGLPEGIVPSTVSNTEQH